MGGQSGLSELSVISWVSAFEGCPLSGVPLYFQKAAVAVLILNLTHKHCEEQGGGRWGDLLETYLNKHPLSTFASKYSTKKGSVFWGTQYMLNVFFPPRIHTMYQLSMHMLTQTVTSPS